jgi:Flp pilus assembly protein TadG
MNASCLCWGWAGTRPPAARRAQLRRAEAGQVAVELALLLPVLLLLLLGALEAGLFLGEQVSVVNASREGARFMLDGASDADVAGLVAGTRRGLFVDPTRFDVWLYQGQTNGAGAVTLTRTAHVAGAGSATGSLTAAGVQARLNGSAGGTAANTRFLVVEVASRHQGFTGRYLLPTGQLVLRAHTLMRRM